MNIIHECHATDSEILLLKTSFMADTNFRDGLMFGRPNVNDKREKIHQIEATWNWLNALQAFERDLNVTKSEKKLLLKEIKANDVKIIRLYRTVVLTV